MRKLIASIPLRGDEELHVRFDEFKRRSYLHIRRYYRDAGGTLLPSNKGITVTPDLLPWLRSQLEAAEREALRDGLLEMEDYDRQGLPVPDIPRMPRYPKAAAS